jgi:release factor glutamine methyltransferase
MFVRMTVKELYRHFLKELQALYTGNEATIITDWVFESVAGIKRSDMVKSPGMLPAENIERHLGTCLAELLDSKPVQYVLGEAWFYKLKLRVNQHVLIPRPETEELVQLVIDQYALYKNQPGETSILDIGTGSGCISIALKKNLPGAAVTAIDISGEALKVSIENAQEHQTPISFSQMNFLDENEWTSLQRFTLIVSNPPYIPLNEREKLDKNVTAFEPATALFVPASDPLLFYDKIARFGTDHLLKKGKILVEIHEDFAEEVLSLFSKYYPRADLRNDLFGKPRMVIAYGDESMA